jgi:hypothetical protein
MAVTVGDRVRNLIDEQLLIISPAHEVGEIVFIDSALGNMRQYSEPPEDPSSSLWNCWLFTTRLRASVYGLLDSSGIVGSANNMVGVFRNDAIIWISDSVITEEEGYLFTTRDINNDGLLEILTLWEGPRTDRGEAHLWIHSWTGSSGEVINDKTDDWIATSVIGGPSDGFVLFDAEGDAILEIKNVSVSDGSLTWSWNGQKYGSWPQTPHLPETTWWPRKEVSAQVSAVARKDQDRLRFEYALRNAVTSKQRINYFMLGEVHGEVILGSPQGWQHRLHSIESTQGWETPTFDHRPQILPGDTVSGFSLVSSGLPAVVPFYVKGYNDVPNPELMSVEEYANGNLLDLSRNSFLGLTIGPTLSLLGRRDEVIIDTISSIVSLSLSLGWIHGEETANAYGSILSRVRTQLSIGDIPAARSTLQLLLAEVERDSGTSLSSEAYALLRFNAEYLLDRLIGASPPFLSSISPEMTLTSSGSFTLFVKGSGFVQGSEILWNGTRRPTTYVSATKLKTRIPGSDIVVPVNASISVRNPDGSGSDRLTFSAVTTLPSPVRPVLECVTHEHGGGFTAWFGYKNENTRSVLIPVGQLNKFSPAPRDREQTTVFQPGRKVKAFSVSFPGSDLVWTLNGRTSTASRNSTRCR